MYKKLITSFIISSISIPPLNASEICSQKLTDRINPRHGYILKIFQEIPDIKVIADAPDVRSFGVSLKKSDGTYKHGWLAQVMFIDNERRSEGVPLCSVLDDKRALFAFPDELSKVGDSVVLCQDDLSIGQKVSCRRLLHVFFDEDSATTLEDVDRRIFLAHGIARKRDF